MDNVFFQFLEEYSTDIKAFLEALIELLKTVFGSDEEAAE